MLPRVRKVVYLYAYCLSTEYIFLSKLNIRNIPAYVIYLCICEFEKNQSDIFRFVAIKSTQLTVAFLRGHSQSSLRSLINVIESRWGVHRKCPDRAKNRFGWLVAENISGAIAWISYERRISLLYLRRKTPCLYGLIIILTIHCDRAMYLRPSVSLRTIILQY